EGQCPPPARPGRGRALRLDRGRRQDRAVVQLDAGETKIGAREAALEVGRGRAPQRDVEPQREERLHPIERELEGLERAGTAGPRELALEQRRAVGPEGRCPVEREPARLAGRSEVGERERQLDGLLLGREHDLQAIDRPRVLALAGDTLAEHEVGGERARRGERLPARVEGTEEGGPALPPPGPGGGSGSPRALRARKRRSRPFAPAIW